MQADEMQELLKKPFPWTREETNRYMKAVTPEEKVKGEYAFRFFLKILCGFLRLLSWNSAHRLGAGIGRLLARLGVRKDVAMTNLDIAFGDTKTREEKEAIFRESMANMVSHIFNYARTPLMNEQFWTDFEIEGEELIKDAYNRGKGIIFTGGHIGEWEIAAGRVGMAGYPISIVAKRQKSRAANRFINDARLDMNLGTIPHKGTMGRVLEGLSRGEGVIMAVDQNMKRSQGVFVDWLGRTASTVRSNAWVARETGAPVLVGHAFRVSPGKLKLVISEEVPWEPYPDDPEQELLINTQNQARAVEKVIRNKPEIWHWVHRRWKVQPEGVPSPYKKK